jgi:P-type E1-E2 ATPase
LPADPRGAGRDRFRAVPAAKQGILIKGGKALETMARIRALVVDKTGTLTAGRAKVVAVHAAPGFSADDVVQIAASLDQASKHVVAQTIVSEARLGHVRSAPQAISHGP